MHIFWSNSRKSMELGQSSTSQIKKSWNKSSSYFCSILYKKVQNSAIGTSKCYSFGILQYGCPHNFFFFFLEMRISEVWTIIKKLEFWFFPKGSLYRIRYDGMLANDIKKIEGEEMKKKIRRNCYRAIT